DPDPRAGALNTAAAQLGLALERPDGVAVADVYFLEGELDETDRDRLHELLVDPLLQRGTWDLPDTAGIEVTLLPGVTDAGGAALLRAAEQLGIAAAGAATGRRIELGPDVTAEQADTTVRRVVANPIVERWTERHAEPARPGD